MSLSKIVSVSSTCFFPVGLAQVIVGVTPVDVGQDKFRVETDSVVVVFYRLQVLPQVSVGVTPIVVGIGITWVETDGIVVVFYRLQVLPQVIVNDASVAVGIGKGRGG